jgi:uncharacterized membrane protein
MVVYHFSWDLSAYGFIAIDVVDDPGWKAFARGIAGTFLLLVGFNLVLATKDGFRARPYFRRLAIIVAAAAAVTMGTYFFAPDEFVYFGILHEIALASILALPFLWAPLWLTAVAAVVVLIAPDLLASPFFDWPPLLWLGLGVSPIPSVDYVPVFPWFGVVLAGIVGGKLFLASSAPARLAAWQPHGGFWRVVIFAGRWSLLIYLLHQLILVGALWLVANLGLGPASPA